MKKRSAVPVTDSCSASSSSSSCVVDQPNDEQSKPNRARRKPKPKPKNNKSQAPNANANATPTRRSSIYRGVTRHRWTGRFEAHLWDKSCWNTIQNKKGRQVYLGAYDSEVDAARTYDLAALKYWGPETTLNFPIENYTKEVEEMQNVSKEEYLATLRRRSSGFSRGVSKYRGVARHHHNGRWEARIGRVFGNKYLYLGTFSSQEEAAAAYDLAAIEYRGPNAVTNFDISNYIDRVKNLESAENPVPDQQPKQKQRRQIKQHKEEDEQQQVPELLEVRKHEEMTMPCHQFEESEVNINSTDNSPMLVMTQHDDEDENRENNNPWSFCLDTGCFDPFLVPDIPLEEDERMLDLFDQTGFEDNIDFIFEGEIDEIKSSEESNKEMEILTNMQKTVSFSCSSPSSTASLVSCQL